MTEELLHNFNCLSVSDTAPSQSKVGLGSIGVETDGSLHGNSHTRSDVNWRCDSCGNINYPRRVKCNRCNLPRVESGRAKHETAQHYHNNSRFLSGVLPNKPPPPPSLSSGIGYGGGSQLNELLTNGLPTNGGNNAFGSYLSAGMCETDTLPSLNLLTYGDGQLPFGSNASLGFPMVPNNPQNGRALYSNLPQGSNLYSAPSMIQGTSGLSQNLLNTLGLYDKTYADQLQLPQHLQQAGNSNPQFNNRGELFPPGKQANACSPIFGTSPLLHPQQNNNMMHGEDGNTDHCDLPPTSNSLQMMLLKAKDVADKLVMEFQNQGDTEATANSLEVLKTSLAMLGHGCEPNRNSNTVSGGGSFDDNPLQGIGGPHFSAPTMLAHPDEFKNPSSFLKIYGDPLCGSVGGNSPIKGQNGNWVCSKCQNVNFPRRFRCNKCSEYRDVEGDEIVSEYAKTVYHQHLRTYKALAAKQGIEIPLKRFNNNSPSNSTTVVSPCHPTSNSPLGSSTPTSALLGLPSQSAPTSPKGMGNPLDSSFSSRNIMSDSNGSDQTTGGKQPSIGSPTNSERNTTSRSLTSGFSTWPSNNNSNATRSKVCAAPNNGENTAATLTSDNNNNSNNSSNNNIVNNSLENNSNNNSTTTTNTTTTQAMVCNFSTEGNNNTANNITGGGGDALPEGLVASTTNGVYQIPKIGRTNSATAGKARTEAATNNAATTKYLAATQHPAPISQLEIGGSRQN